MDCRARRSAIFSDAHPQPPWLAINAWTNRDSERGRISDFFPLLLVLARFFQTATPIRFVMSIFSDGRLFLLLSRNRVEKLKRAAPWRAHSKSRAVVGSADGRSGRRAPAGRARRRARVRGFGVAPVPWTPPPVPPAPGVRDGRGGAPVAPRRDPRGRLAGELRHRGPAPAVRGRGGALPEGERRVRRVRRGLQDVHGVRRRAEQPVPLRRVRGVRRSRERRVQRRLPGLRRGSARRERGGRLRRVPRPRRRGVLARGRARFAPRRVRRVRRHSEQRQRAGRLRRLRGPRVRARRSHQAIVVLRLRGDGVRDARRGLLLRVRGPRVALARALWRRRGGPARGARAGGGPVAAGPGRARGAERRRDGVSRCARRVARARRRRRDRSARGPHLQTLVLAVRARRARARGVRRGLGHHA